MLLIEFRYVETIDLIYSTNTLHITGSALLENIQVLLLPQRFSKISSLELVFEMRHYGPPISTEDLTRAKWSEYRGLIGVIDTAFPAAKKIYISVCVGIPWNIDEISHQLLEPADALVRGHWSTLQEFQLAPNLCLYRDLMRKVQNDGVEIQEDGLRAGAWYRFWRPVMMMMEFEDLPTKEIGYWIRRGVEDKRKW